MEGVARNGFLLAADLCNGLNFRLFQGSTGIIARQPSRPKKAGQTSLWITMDTHFDLHILVERARSCGICSFKPSKATPLSLPTTRSCCSHRLSTKFAPTWGKKPERLPTQAA